MSDEKPEEPVAVDKPRTYRNVADGARLVPANEEVQLDIGGGWAWKKLNEACYELSFPEYHKERLHVIYVPASLIDRAIDAAIQSGQLERAEDEWPECDEEPTSPT